DIHPKRSLWTARHLIQKIRANSTPLTSCRRPTAKGGGQPCLLTGMRRLRGILSKSVALPTAPTFGRLIRADPMDGERDRSAGWTCRELRDSGFACPCDPWRGFALTVAVPRGFARPRKESS